MDLFLEKDDDPQTLAFVSARNARSDKALATPEMEADAEALRSMMERQDRLIVPTRRGDWLFDFNRSRDNPLGVLRRLPAKDAPRADAAWDTVFDVDAFCTRDGKRWIFGGCVTCPFEPTRVLLRLSDGGSDLTRFLEFDLETKRLVDGGFDTPAVRAQASWLSADEIAYFGSIDAFSATQSGWPRVGRRLRRGEEPAEAEILFEAAPSDVTGYGFIIDPELGGHTGPDTRQIRVFMANHEIGKLSLHVEDADGVARRLPLPREIGFDINHSHILWLAKSDEQVASGSLVLQALTPFDSEPLAPKRRVLVEPSPGRAVHHFTLLRHWAIYTVDDRLSPELYALDLTQEDAVPQRIELPAGIEALYFTPLHADLHLGDDTLHVIGSGFLVPPTRYALALSDQDRNPAKEPLALVPQETSPAFFDAEGMSSELLEATSKDGTKVPYHLVLPKAWTKGQLPVLIYGYGGFAASLAPHYSGTTGRFLEQGGAYVQAYIRGGSELGPEWHTPVKRHGRHKAYEDFVAIARDLVKRGYTNPSRIACTGGSNGGLLTGVMLTRYPDDFGAVWCRVPVLDMTRFHLFPAGRAWMDEYGNPDDEEDRAYLLGYSPLHQVKPASDQAYPPVYIESSSNDDRVHPSHARRFAMRLEEAGHLPLFHEYGSGGHGGAGNSAEMARRTAMGYSFLRQTIMKA
ncbi:prolyl oligopeptidase [Agrobacterium albertimagni AOL15]|uniref:Prolyl oligopeptidase n=1 Tax=Agrobacterium albertimagni AOL15 TaxID=1156935 RepID=K2QBG3_9HYPH|nr:prolyl oligopeptidase family serine peptidase [Agrobacterium albertimagni]EKF58381.1 prolyl oligopeptidase [Agrobacterium albertimagni AOL15]